MNNFDTFHLHCVRNFFLTSRKHSRKSNLKTKSVIVMSWFQYFTKFFAQRNLCREFILKLSVLHFKTLRINNVYSPKSCRKKVLEELCGIATINNYLLYISSLPLLSCLDQSWAEEPRMLLQNDWKLMDTVPSRARDPSPSALMAPHLI